MIGRQTEMTGLKTVLWCMLPGTAQHHAQLSDMVKVSHKCYLLLETPCSKSFLLEDCLTFIFGP